MLDKILHVLKIERKSKGYIQVLILGKIIGNENRPPDFEYSAKK